MTPTLFISHGAPDIEFTRPPVTAFLTNLARRFPRPKTILCVSAHWETAQPALSGVDAPELIYDFNGFARELYDLEYRARGNPELAEEVQGVLSAAGIDAVIDAERGLDHGAWVPLRLMYPAADIPVVQLSVQPQLAPEHHMQIGRLLRRLRKQDVLILGSGGATHNLREFGKYGIDAPPVDEAAAFDQWLEDRITRGDEQEVLRYAKSGPYAQWNHPSAEHFLPLFAPLGASAGDAGVRLHQSFTYGVLSMSAYGWGW